MRWRALRVVFLLLIVGAKLAQPQSDSQAEALLRRGLDLAQAGQLDEAAEAFRAGAREHPGDPRFVLELAGVSYRNKNNPEAVKYLRRALRLA